MSIATKCTCGHSLNGVCASSVKECNQLINMENKCPNCHSTNIRNDSIRNNNGIIGPGYKSWLVEEKYSCNDCGVYFKPVTDKDLNLVVMGHGKPDRAVTGPRWVKASCIEIKYAITYYAKWEDDKHLIKGTGWFQMSDGTFFWDKEGYVPIGVDERNGLLILDESTPAGMEEDAIALIKHIRENYKRRNVEWTDNFGIATLTDQGIYELFKQKTGRK